MKAGEAKIRLQELLGIPEDVRAQNIGPKTREAFDRLAATPNDQEWAPKPVDGVNRTDWRGFKPVNADKLRDALPDHARFLVSYFLDNAITYNLNPLFLAAISRHETANWTSNVFRTKANAMGISDQKGAVSQESYNASIRTAAYSLSKPGGYYAKAKTLADVGAVYAPVGAKNDPTKLNGAWPTGVARYWSELEKTVA